MKIKTYRDESVSAALKRARTEMGPEALLLKTRKLTNALGNDRFEVTACVTDESTATPVSNQDINTQSRVPDQLQDESIEVAPEAADEYDNSFEIINERLETIESKLTNFISQYGRRNRQDSIQDIADRLKDADCDDIDIQQLLASPYQGINGDGSIVFEKAVNAGLTNLLTQIIEPRIEFQHGDSAIVFGPAGSGKTSFAAKLSAHLLLQYRLKVSPETLEFANVSPIEQIPVSPEEMDFYRSTGNGESKTEVITSKTVSVIDTPSCPQDNHSLEQLLVKFQELQPTHRFFVFSALTRNADLQELIANVQMLQPTHLVMTMAELTSRYGSILSVVRILECPLAFITDSPGGIGVLKTPDPNDLARAILNQKEQLCKS